MDLDVFKNGPKLIDAKSTDYVSMLTRVAHKPGGSIIYVYSPYCGACKARAPGFVKAYENLTADMRSRVFRFNAALAEGRDEIFEKIVGFTITEYPTLLGISNQGRLVKFGDFNASTLKTSLLALAQT